MSTSWADELAFAEHLADVADEISMRFFRRAETAVRSKADGTPVTEADELIERTLRAEIAAAYPDHGVFGEEEGETAGAGDARWILDPIDGTKNYSWGIRNWATLIALEVEHEIVCGVASAPAVGDRFSAGRGAGAHCNGEPMRVSETSALSEARLGFTSAAEFDRKGFGDRFRRLLATVAHDRGIGDFLGHMLVARGSLDVMFEPLLSPWDMGPLIVILEEAGGRLTDFGGRAHIYGGSCLSTNGRLHEAMLEFLGKAD